MKTICILGAGQFGRTAAYIINTNQYQILSFGDNNSMLHGTSIEQIPVMSIERSVQLNPELILIGLMGNDRTLALINQARNAGYQGEFVTIQNLYELFDIRTATLYRIAFRLREQNISGSLAELGVYKGDTARILNTLFPERTLYLFDTFTGFDDRDIQTEQHGDFSYAQKGDFADTNENHVINRLIRPENAVIKKGYFPESLDKLEDIFSLVSLDADLYAPILAGLEYFYPRLNSGGMLVLHDYNNERFRGARQAVRDYESAHGKLLLIPLADLHGSAVIIHP